MNLYKFVIDGWSGGHTVDLEHVSKTKEEFLADCKACIKAAAMETLIHERAMYVDQDMIPHVSVDDIFDRAVNLMIKFNGYAQAKERLTGEFVLDSMNPFLSGRNANN